MDMMYSAAMTKAGFPRVLIAGLAGDTGKSLVSLGLSGALRRKGLRVAPFKKGPDFIDAAWLGEAAGTAGRNLDTFLMPAEAIVSSLRRAPLCAGVGIIEGNRGLFDGMDAEGSHSTALLARLTGTPVVLVVDVTKVTRTIAALVLGCRTLDPSLRLAGGLLNRVGTAPQEGGLRGSRRGATGQPGPRRAQGPRVLLLLPRELLGARGCRRGADVHLPGFRQRTPGDRRALRRRGLPRGTRGGALGQRRFPGGVEKEHRRRPAGLGRMRRGHVSRRGRV